MSPRSALFYGTSTMFTISLTFHRSVIAGTGVPSWFPKRQSDCYYQLTLLKCAMSLLPYHTLIVFWIMLVYRYTEPIQNGLSIFLQASSAKVEVLKRFA
jgi:hypothetical protein